MEIFHPWQPQKCRNNSSCNHSPECYHVKQQRWNAAPTNNEHRWNRKLVSISSPLTSVLRDHLSEVRNQLMIWETEHTLGFSLQPQNSSVPQILSSTVFPVTFEQLQSRISDLDRTWYCHLFYFIILNVIFGLLLSYDILLRKIWDSLLTARYVHSQAGLV